MSNQKAVTSGDAQFVRYALVAVLIVLAFLMSYRFAQGRGVSEGAPGSALPTQAAPGEALPCGGCGTGGGCGAGTGETIEGSAVLDSDGVQRIAVDTSAGYSPNLIRLAAGVPAEITFGQGAGCFAEVKSNDLGFYADLTSGPKTVAIPPLEPGIYGFECGMDMVFGSILVQ